MKYQDALHFLLNLELFGIKLGLDNIRKFIARLGNPQDSYQSIHVAGTNGKGSTAAVLEAIAVESGYKVGKFTSPHLVDYIERFRINKAKVSGDYVARFVSDHKDFIRKERITFFETATALAFQLFKDEKVDIAIAEVGLGGRLDATNVLTPAVSVITQLALDHLKVLGDNMTKIATEKCGIIKDGIPVVTSAVDHEALEVVEAFAKSRSTTVTRLVPDMNYRVTGVEVPFTGFSFSRNSDEPVEYKTNLIGRHMAENAGLALLTTAVLEDLGTHFSVDGRVDGLKKVYWPGRFQILDRKPKVICDVAHNPHGMTAFADTLEAIFPGKKFVVVMGVLQRRDFDLLFDQVARFTRTLILCKPNTHRAAVMEELVHQAVAHGLEFTVIESCAEAFEHAVSLEAEDRHIIVTGSHFTVGEVFQAIGVET